MILKLSASGWFLFNFIIDDARSHERETTEILYLVSSLETSGNSVVTCRNGHE
jgi:hypothetical protein